MNYEGVGKVDVELKRIGGGGLMGYCLELWMIGYGFVFVARVCVCRGMEYVEVATILLLGLLA